MKQQLTFSFDSSAAQAPLFEFQALKGFWLLGASYCPQTYTGTPTSSNIDINDDGTAIAAAVCSVATAGTPATYKTTGLGGSVAIPAHVDADSIVAIDLNFVAGTSPTAVDGAIVLTIDVDE